MLDDDVLAQSGVPVAPVQLIDLPARGISRVTVCDPENAEAITTSSCGNGTRLVQAFADQLPPLVPLHVCVAPLVNVIPELPPQSPLNPVIADRFQLPAPAPTMSRKSAYEHVTFAAVKVTGVSSVLDFTNRRLMLELPDIVNAVVTV